MITQLKAEIEKVEKDLIEAKEIGAGVLEFECQSQLSTLNFCLKLAEDYEKKRDEVIDKEFGDYEGDNYILKEQRELLKSKLKEVGA